MQGMDEGDDHDVSDLAVLRFGPGFDGFDAGIGGLDGTLIDLTKLHRLTLSTDNPSIGNGAKASPTGRFEIQPDNRIAEVWEISW